MRYRQLFQLMDFSKDKFGGLHLDDDGLHLHVAVPHCRLTLLCAVAENLGGIWVSFQRPAPCQLISIVSSACSFLQTLHIPVSCLMPTLYCRPYQNT